MLTAKVTTKHGSFAFLRLTVDVRDKKQLDQVAPAIKGVSDVYDAHRQTVLNLDEKLLFLFFQDFSDMSEHGAVGRTPAF